MTIPNLPITITTTNEAWLTIARPIIKAMFAVEDAGFPIGKERLADPRGFVPYGQMSPAARDWQEAQTIINKAYDALMAMLEGIRDNALCDAYVSVDYDASEDVIAAQDDWNEELARGVMGVDAAVRMIGEEA